MKEFGILFCILSCFSVHSFAQKSTFRAKYLRETASFLNLTMLDTLKENSQSIIDYKGQDIIVIKNESDVITHIGRHIFATLLRDEHPSPIYNYIEYAMLDNQFHFNENPFIYKDMKFIRGNWKDMEQVTDSTAFEIGVIQNKLYVVKWNLDDGETIELMFPINYERLSLTNRKELEQNIIRDMQNFRGKPLKNENVNIGMLNQQNKHVWQLKGKTYLVPEINNNLYFTIDSTGIKYLCDANYPVESVSNLCVAADKMDTTCLIEITFIKYDYTQQTVKLNMNDFVAYMKSEGCVPFWGTEKNKNGIIEGSLYFYNKDNGYDHIFKIETSLKQLSSIPKQIKATAYLLSPTSNVKDLNYPNSSNHNKIQPE